MNNLAYTFLILIISPQICLGSGGDELNLTCAKLLKANSSLNGPKYVTSDSRLGYDIHWGPSRLSEIMNSIREVNHIKSQLDTALYNSVNKIENSLFDESLPAKYFGKQKKLLATLKEHFDRIGVATENSPDAPHRFFILPISGRSHLNDTAYYGAKLYDTRLFFDYTLFTGDSLFAEYRADGNIINLNPLAFFTKAPDPFSGHELTHAALSHKERLGEATSHMITLLNESSPLTIKNPKPGTGDDPYPFIDFQELLAYSDSLWMSAKQAFETSDTIQAAIYIDLVYKQKSILTEVVIPKLNTTQEIFETLVSASASEKLKPQLPFKSKKDLIRIGFNNPLVMASIVLIEKSHLELRIRKISTDLNIPDQIVTISFVHKKLEQLFLNVVASENTEALKNFTSTIIDLAVHKIELTKYISDVLSNALVSIPNRNELKLNSLGVQLAPVLGLYDATKFMHSDSIERKYFNSN